VTKIVAALLVVWEPLRFAGEALTVFPTLSPRGWTAGFELAAHGLVAALASAAGLALWNGGPDSKRLATAAIAALVVRVAQSLYWSVLPSNTMPGDQPLILAAALVIAASAITALHTARST